VRNLLRSAWDVVRLVWEADPARALAAASTRAIQVSIWTLFPFYLKVLVDGAVHHDRSRAITAALCIAISLALAQAAWMLMATLSASLQEHISQLVDRRLMTVILEAPTLEPFERPELADELEILRTEKLQIVQAASTAVDVLGVAVRGTLTLVLLATVHPALLLLVLCGLPGLWTMGRSHQEHQAALTGAAERRRVAHHLFTLITAPASGKELRIYGLQSELPDRHQRALADADRAVNRRAWRAAGYDTAGWAVFAAGYVLVIGFVVHRVSQGRASAGDLALVAGLAAQVNGLVGEARGQLANLLGNLAVMDRFARVHEIARPADAGARGSRRAPARVEDGLVLADVSFTYPGTSRPVLHDVSLHVPAGTTVAIVGENGAGKTTLVKLLLGLYEPTAGRISVDGTDLAELSRRSWWSSTAACFQDFARFELLARENVGVGEVAVIDDDAFLETALAAADATGTVTALPRGLDTQLGRTFEGGVELSGGQWQKLALARSMLRELPVLLVLDEPTASLDAPSESALFERYAQAACTTAVGAGAVTVLVSHRFSTVRMADLIVVLDGGRIVEIGSHDELMERADVYAELYSLQAAAYK
jgi:ABC-type multidrug transport system fused ATPase/permease subunit